MGRPRTFDEDVVVARAMEAFWTNGYASTSPAQLAEATGIAKGSLYNAFKSKRDLFERALALYAEQTSALAQELLAAPGTTEECLRAALRSIVDFDMAQSLRRGCLVGNTTVELAGHDPRLARMIRAIQDRQVTTLADRIDQGRRDGDVRGDADPLALAEFLSNTLAGLRVMAVTQDAGTLYRVIDTALATLH